MFNQNYHNSILQWNANFLYIYIYIYAFRQTLLSKATYSAFRLYIFLLVCGVPGSLYAGLLQSFNPKLRPFLTMTSIFTDLPPYNQQTIIWKVPTSFFYFFQYPFHSDICHIQKKWALLQFHHDFNLNTSGILEAQWHFFFKAFSEETRCNLFCHSCPSRRQQWHILVNISWVLSKYYLMSKNAELDVPMYCDAFQIYTHPLRDPAGFLRAL